MAIYEEDISLEPEDMEEILTEISEDPSLLFAPPPTQPGIKYLSGSLAQKVLQTAAGTVNVKRVSTPR